MASILGSNSKSKLFSGSNTGGSGKKKKGKFSNPILILIVILGVLLIGLTYSFFSSISATETYWVLGTDVPAHSQITADDMQAVKTRKGTAPKSISLADVQSGQVYAQYDLLAGDVLTNSNTGGRASLYNGVSDQWAVTSFTISSSDAVDGNIQRGDYFDILGMGQKQSENGNTVEGAVTVQQGGTYIYYNVMCLFTTLQKTSETAKDGTTTTTGESVEYFVAMPPKDIAMLQSALSSLQIKLVLSPRENTYKQPNANAYAFSTFSYNGENIQPRNASLCDDSKPDSSSDCTDNTFKDVRRNEFGVPYDVSEDQIDQSTGKPKEQDGSKLTKAEISWCNELFDKPYYLGSRWDSDKQYCKDQASGDDATLKKWDEAEKKASDTVADSKTGSSDSVSQNSTDSSNTSSGVGTSGSSN